jgi:hypothetical protein
MINSTEKIFYRTVRIIYRTASIISRTESLILSTESLNPVTAGITFLAKTLKIEGTKCFNNTLTTRE